MLSWQCGDALLAVGGSINCTACNSHWANLPPEAARKGHRSQRWRPSGHGFGQFIRPPTASTNICFDLYVQGSHPVVVSLSPFSLFGDRLVCFHDV